MKTSIDFQALKKSVTEEHPLPFKVVRPSEIRYLGETGDDMSIIKVHGAELPASKGAIIALDKYCGLSSGQKSAVSCAGGQQGVQDITNYLTAAKGLATKGQLALILDPEKGVLKKIVPIRNEVITPTTFMDISECFMKENDLIPAKFELSALGDQMTLRMASEKSEIRSILPGDDAQMGGYSLSWNLSGISLSMETVRLVCTNGMTHKVTERRANISSLDSQSVQDLIAIPSNRNLIDGIFDKFKSRAIEAKSTPASLYEVQTINHKLSAYGIPMEVCDEIAPYREDLAAYEELGLLKAHGNAEKTRLVVSKINAWDLFNNMTAFASHTEIIDDHDLLRGLVRQEAMIFLSKPRDIKHYTSIY